MVHWRWARRMRYQSRMDRGFMAHSFLRPVFWSGVAVTLTLCSRRILFAGKMPATTEEAIWMPETVIDKYSLEIAGKAGDAPIDESLGDLRRNANLSESWHSVHRIGRAEVSYFSVREG